MSRYGPVVPESQIAAGRSVENTERIKESGDGEGTKSNLSTAMLGTAATEGDCRCRTVASWVLRVVRVQERADRAARACRKMGRVVVYLPAIHAFRVGQSRCSGKGTLAMAGPSAASVVSFSTISGQGVRCGLLPSLQQAVPTTLCCPFFPRLFSSTSEAQPDTGQTHKAKVTQRTSTGKNGGQMSGLEMLIHSTSDASQQTPCLWQTKKAAHRAHLSRLDQTSVLTLACPYCSPPRTGLQGARRRMEKMAIWLTRVVLCVFRAMPLWVGPSAVDDLAAPSRWIHRATSPKPEPISCRGQGMHARHDTPTPLTPARQQKKPLRRWPAWLCSVDAVAERVQEAGKWEAARDASLSSG